jgi:hypothetical protein
VDIKHKTREAWLTAALPTLCAMLTKAGAAAFPMPLLSMGLPHNGAFGKKQTIGQCWYAEAQQSKKQCAIFISPVLGDPVKVLDVLTHELIHAACGPKAGHKGSFKTVALAVGLTGKMTATKAGPELQKTLKALAEKLGKLPHDPLTNHSTMKKPQKNRQLLFECEECGKKIRCSDPELQATHADCDGAAFILQDVGEGGDDNRAAVVAPTPAAKSGAESAIASLDRFFFGKG